MIKGKNVTPRKRFFKLQWSLRTMFLLTAVVAAWVPYFHLQQKIARIEQKVDSMRNMACELVIDDTSKITVIKKQEKWWDEHRWEIHLPDGEYTMRLATREIDEEGFAPAAGETRVPAGRHFIALLQSDDGNCHGITITLDDQPVIEIKESQDWNTSNHATMEFFGKSRQLPPDEPVVLFRRRFIYQKISINDPAKGLLLWIERMPPAPRGQTP